MGLKLVPVELMDCTHVVKLGHQLGNPAEFVAGYCVVRFGISLFVDILICSPLGLRLGAAYPDGTQDLNS